jgi:hypothetical protein
MKNILSYRAMASLCRQQAVFHPEDSWKWLGQAERWEHLVDAEIASHFEECNISGSSDLAKSGAPSDARDTRRLIAAA